MSRASVGLHTTKHPKLITVTGGFVANFLMVMHAGLIPFVSDVHKPHPGNSLMPKTP